MKRKVYQNLTSPSYERYVFVDSVNGRYTNVIYIYRATNGNDTWHIRKGQYYTSNLKMSREGRHEMIKYLGEVDIDAEVGNFLFDNVRKLKEANK